MKGKEKKKKMGGEGERVPVFVENCLLTCLEGGGCVVGCRCLVVVPPRLNEERVMRPFCAGGGRAVLLIIDTRRNWWVSGSASSQVSKWVGGRVYGEWGAI